MLGLKRGTVVLVPYKKAWQVLFEKEKELLEKQIGNFLADIQHIGSTSIPGINAKPILDIAIGVMSLKEAHKFLVARMQRLGYELRPRENANAYELLFVKGPESRRTHYVHVIRYRGRKWNKARLFRDYLRTHPKRAQQYAALKKELVKKYAHDRFNYTKGKEVFIKKTLKIAEKLVLPQKRSSLRKSGLK